jgi:hypothetical protein
MALLDAISIQRHQYQTGNLSQIPEADRQSHTGVGNDQLMSAQSPGRPVDPKMVLIQAYMTDELRSVKLEPGKHWRTTNN